MKRLFVLAVAFAMASLSQASELWWTVSNPANSVSWETAKLYASANGYNTGGTELDSVSASDMAAYTEIITSLGDYGNSAYSFYVELFNGSGDSLGKSYVSASQGATPYDTLLTAGAIDTGNSIMNPPSLSVYTGFSTYTTSEVIPEPTSGLLVLFGMMALGLKRKRV